jgi:hypothetical protein
MFQLVQGLFNFCLQFINAVFPEEHNMKNIIKIIAINVILFGANKCYAQDWKWSKHFGNPENNIGHIYTYKNNIFLLSYENFSGAYYYINNDTLRLFDGNIILSKLTSEGNTIWNKQMKSASNCVSMCNLVINKKDGSIYLYGGYCSSLTSDCGGIFNSGSAGTVFITKLDSLGNCLWGQKIDSTFLDYTDAATLDDSSNLYLAAHHLTDVYYGSNLIAAGSVISKFDPQGNCLWAKNFTYLTYEGFARLPMGIKDIKLHNGFIYIKADEYNDTITIDSTTHIHTGKSGALLAKLTLDANLIWYKEGISYDTQSSLDGLGFDDNGNIYSVGLFHDSINFDGNVMYGGPMPFVGTNTENYFVKYDSLGNLIWAKHFHAGNIYFSTGSHTSLDGYTYITSGFTDSLIIDNYHIYPTGTSEVYLAKFSPNGNCLGIKHFGDGEGMFVETDDNNDLIVLSQMGASATVDNNTYSNYGTYSDIILSKSSQITGIIENEGQRKNSLMINANPSSGVYNILIPDAFKKTKSILTLYIFDYTGKIIRSCTTSMKEDAIKLNIETEPGGIYLATLSDGQIIYNGKIVLE